MTQSLDAQIAWAVKGRDCLAQIDRADLPVLRDTQYGPRELYGSLTSSLDALIDRLQKIQADPKLAKRRRR